MKDERGKFVYYGRVVIVPASDDVSIEDLLVGCGKDSPFGPVIVGKEISDLDFIR